MNENLKIFPLGDRAITIEFGNRISSELNDRVLSLTHFFTQNPFSGMTEIVPAYGSLTVFYDVYEVRKSFPDYSTVFDAVKGIIETALRNATVLNKREVRLIRIPVCFDAEFAIDLEFVARENKLSPEAMIEIFVNKTYRVFLLGFLPGFAYMGEVEEQIATPRKAAPRVRVPEGSVGIAGRQTGIYSLESPGGWQIIGRTPIRLFDPQNEPPTFLQAGDEVRFYEIDKNAFHVKKP
jgi:inhibitor of KinA